VTHRTGILSVGALVALLQDLVETNFVTVTVQGEISNFTVAASGHWYFTLKDPRAQLRCVMFRGRNRLLAATPADGLQVVCGGSISVYAARGELQMIVEEVTPGGQGQLQAAFEALKTTLAAEGLFAETRKRPLPAYPRAVGLVTSATGAAVRDMINVMQRRAPDVHLLLRPVRVQGEGAAAEIAEAIADLNKFGGLDVLIVGRGGGSIEDLWAFNEEIVARAIAASEVPVISAVGHETDVTIADYVADLRAPTPSAAAELVAKNRQELEAHLDHLVIRLTSRIDQILQLAAARLDGYERQLLLQARALREMPQRVADLDHRLGTAIRVALSHNQDRLAIAAGRLTALSPLQQLARGFAIVSRDRDGSGLTSTQSLAAGDRLWLRFAEGRAVARVEEVDE
jgi:exodeoxyribonuclease VII large subunit